MEALVEAGFLAAGRYGVEGMTTRHIAEIAGVGVGSLYEYFSDKQAVIEAMNQRMVDDIVNLIRPNIADLVQLSPRDLVLDLLLRYRAFLAADDQRYGRYVSGLSPRGAAQASRRISAALGQLAMQYLLRNPQFAQLPRLPVISYIAIHGGINVVAQHLSEREPPFAFEELAEGLADMVDRMFSPR